jgi:hypothetical protein
VTATDLFANTKSAQVSVVRDLPPVLTVSEPLDFSVARPTLHVQADCSDENSAGCSSLSVFYDRLWGMPHPPFSDPPVFYATGTSHIDAVISLDALDGKNILLVFDAVDSKGQHTTATRTIFVDSSAKLREVQSTVGRIIDFDDARFLVLSDGQLTIVDRASGNRTPLPNLSEGTPTGGQLTPYGAIWQSNHPTEPYWRVAEWNQTQLIQPIQNHCVLADAAGTRAALAESTTNGGWVLWLRDLQAGTNTELARPGNAPSVALLESGDLAFDNGGLFIYHAGVATRQPGVGFMVAYDGVHLVYSDVTQNFAIMLSDTTPITLAPGAFGIYGPPHYQVSGGWIAFTRPGGGVRQVFRRSAAGQEEQLSVWGTESLISSMNPNGEVLLVNGGRRYRGKPGTIPELLASSLGTFVWKGGVWYDMIGRSLMALQDDADGGPTPGDAGGGDAMNADAVGASDASNPPDGADVMPADGGGGDLDAPGAPNDVRGPMADASSVDVSTPAVDGGAHDSSMATRDSGGPPPPKDGPASLDASSPPAPPPPAADDSGCSLVSRGTQRRTVPWGAPVWVALALLALKKRRRQVDRSAKIALCKGDD